MRMKGQHIITLAGREGGQFPINGLQLNKHDDGDGN